jgi:tRNA pseudouridine55 synthase
LTDPNPISLPQQFIDGSVILIDKPLYWTSFDAVNKVKSLLKHRLGLKKLKVGHAGTLDPLASGLLIICTGKMTRRIDEFQAQEKEYTGTFFIGQTTPSADLETKPGTTYPTDHIDWELVNQVSKQFIGEIEQVPPLFSAKKIDGKRAYKHARRGDDIVLKPNLITIQSFTITRLELPEADFKVVCGKGTYIRSLARDFGEQLNSGAYLQQLRRTRIGQFSISQAQSLEDFQKIIDAYTPVE